jgi:long-chain acyl-CoA synthetase
MAEGILQATFLPRRGTRVEKRVARSLEYYLSAAFFNTFPLPQREAARVRRCATHGELITSGFSVLIFPEGKRTEHGEIAPFRPGVGMMAARLGRSRDSRPVAGIDRVLHQSWKMAKPGLSA